MCFEVNLLFLLYSHLWPTAYGWYCPLSMSLCCACAANANRCASCCAPMAACSAAMRSKALRCFCVACATAALACGAFASACKEKWTVGYKMKLTSRNCCELNNKTDSLSVSFSLSLSSLSSPLYLPLGLVDGWRALAQCDCTLPSAGAWLPWRLRCLPAGDSTADGNRAHRQRTALCALGSWDPHRRRRHESHQIHRIPLYAGDPHDREHDQPDSWTHTAWPGHAAPVWYSHVANAKHPPDKCWWRMHKRPSDIETEIKHVVYTHHYVYVSPRSETASCFVCLLLELRWETENRLAISRSIRCSWSHQNNLTKNWSCSALQLFGFAASSKALPKLVSCYFCIHKPDKFNIKIELNLFCSNILDTPPSMLYAVRAQPRELLEIF